MNLSPVSVLSRAGVLRPAALVLLSVVLAGCATLSGGASRRFEVMADCGAKSRCYTSVQAALDAAEADTSGDWVRIEVATGSFYEKVTVRRARTELDGAGSDRTRIVFDAVAQTAGKYHRNNWGTPGSATLTIDADEVKVEGIKVENSYDYLANDALPDGDARKISNPQAVAVLADIHSDRVSILRSALVGYQDTLFANGKRLYIKNSFISGNVDFIFGNGQVLIEDSTVESRKRAPSAAAETFQSFVAAPSTQLSQPLGIIFYRSRLTREVGVPDSSVGLARPWHPTTRFPDGRYADPNAVGQAIFIDCFMDAHIHPDHWTFMNGTARDGSKNAIFQPQDSRFYEAGSTGPGARARDIGMRWKPGFTIEQARHMFFDGWPAADR